MINDVTLVGRLSVDLELKKIGETELINFNIAVPRDFKNEDGNYETDFIRCVAFGNLATRLNEYCKKGDLVGIIGKIQVSNYEDKDGNRRTSYEVVCSKISFLSSKKVEDEK